MKRILIFTYWFLVLFNLKMIGQSDTINSSNIDDSLTIQGQTRKHQYLNANFRKEKTLLKIGISPLDILSDNNNFSYTTFNSTLCLEKKLNTSISLVIFNNADFWIYGSSLEWMYSFDFGVRYYYSMKRRIRESTGSNNFHGNYFSIKINKVVSYFNKENARYINADGITYDRNWNFNPSSVSLSWGIQRRLGRYGFVDLGPYLKIGDDVANVGFNLLFGLGIGK